MDGTGCLSRVADNVESVQLGNPKASAGELRFLAARLTEVLRDAVQVAESRGARLPVPDDDPDAIEPDDGEGTDDDQGVPQLPAEAFG
jgi:hypothetical protein